MQIMSKLADLGANMGSRLYQIRLDPENRVVGAMIRELIMCFGPSQGGVGTQ